MRGTESDLEPASESEDDLPLGVGLIVFSVFVIVESARFPVRSSEGFLMSPGFVPLLCGFSLLVLSLILTLSAVRRGRRRGMGRRLLAKATSPENRRFLVITAIIGFYVVGLLGRVHFFVATLIFHVLIFGYLKVAGPLRTAFYALVASIFVAYLLPKIFEMPLPL